MRVLCRFTNAIERLQVTSAPCILELLQAPHGFVDFPWQPDFVQALYRKMHTSTLCVLWLGAEADYQFAWCGQFVSASANWAHHNIS